MCLRWTLITKLIIAMLWFPLVSQAAAELPASIAQALRTHGIPETDVSLYVSPVSGESPILVLNEAIPRNPASVMKLLTSLVALDTLGPNFHWRTEAYIDGTLADGRLTGDLILKGYGDPYLTPERFWQFLYGLHERGIEQIHGNLIIDNSYFAAPTAQRSDFDAKPRRAYNALPYPLSLNFQATQLHLLPDESGESILAFTYPPLANLTIHNHLKAVSGPCRKQHLRPKVNFTEQTTGASVEIQGDYSLNCPEWNNPYLVMDPEDHIAGAFTALWQEMGGQLDGVIKPGIRPRQAKLFHSVESPSLAEVIRGMNKYSNNLMSRMLLLTMSAERWGAPARVETGKRLIADWLDRAKLPSPSLVRVSNGAGLSRNTQISAETIGRLLQMAFASPVMPEFMASLAIVGIDGTMRNRLRKSGLAGRAHIKTGSLNDVSAMAGYVQDRHNQRWVVSLIINHPGLQNWQGKQIQDALLRWVYQSPVKASSEKGLITETSVTECGDQLQAQVQPEVSPDRHSEIKVDKRSLQTAAIDSNKLLDQ